MTKKQTGRYRHGVYGYPVTIELVPVEGAEIISFAGLTKVTLSLKSNLSGSAAAVERELAVPGCIESESPAAIKWTVLDGDIPTVGPYRVVLTLDYGDTQRMIVEGLLDVE